MNKSDITGWREVFSFTFAQTVKQKSYAIFLVIFSVVALFYSTVTAIIKQVGDRKESKAAVSEVVIFDETDLQIEYKDVFTSKKYRNVTVVSNPSKSIEEYEKQMEENADDTMLIKITFDKEYEQYDMLFVLGKKISMSEIAKVDFSDEFCDFFREASIEAVGISKEQRDFVKTPITREVKELSETGEVIEKKKEGISYTDYFITLAFLMICMMLINISGNQIALSIVTEKSTRVIEYLALNVRPLALIFGKLLASIVTSLLQMITVGFCYIASPIVSNMLTPRILKWFFGITLSAESNTEIADETLANSVKMIHGIKIEYIFLALIFMVLGIIFFGIIAGLLGACASKMEEMQETMSLFQILLVFGCYADMALIVIQISGKANPILSKILSICPVTSPFLVPCNMLLGKMSCPLILASFLAMIVVIVLLFLLTANVYEAMIFYNGKALKIKDIISLASSKKISVKGEEKNEK